MTLDPKALEKAWTDFLDANPDGLTSPEDLPDHALMTCEQFVQCAMSAALRTGAEPVAVKVKPMRWEAQDRDGILSIGASILGEYRVCFNGKQWETTKGMSVIGRSDLKSAAMQIGDADLEARIRSCILGGDRG